MDLDRSACDRARRSRDARFDGRFFIGVTSTRIYCRPICPARAPKDEHIRYFPTAAAAEAEGFRPCLRCRPEASPGTPAWVGNGVVSRALRLIAEGALDDQGVEQLADRVGVTGRHLRRLFVQHLGAKPLDVALTRRVHFAKKLLDETPLAMCDVAFAAGFGSVRRFNSQMRRTFGRAPSDLRRCARARLAARPEHYRFRLAYRPPYDWEGILAFLGARVTPGVESVSDGHYRRTIRIDDKVGVIDVYHLPSRGALGLEVHFPEPRALLPIVERVRRLFDLGADPRIIHEHLGADPLLSGPLAAWPGIRSPGAWDGFEIAVHALLGGPRAICAAAALAGRIASLFGSPVADVEGLVRLFPTPAQLAEASVEQAGATPPQAAAIRSVARHVAAHGLRPDDGGVIVTLSGLEGADDGIVQYVAMRSPGEPDAFPSGDAALRRAAGGCTAHALERRSAGWRPWRAYAAMLFWRAMSNGSAAKRPGPTRLSSRGGRPPAALEDPWPIGLTESR